MSTHLQRKVVHLDLEYMEGIVENFQFGIFRYCYQMVRSKETAEDITQEVFIKFCQLSSKKEYSPRYLYAIAHSKCIDYLRKEKRKYVFFKNYNAETHEESTEDLFFENELSHELETILNSLTSYEKSVLLLKSVSGLSYKEMSEILKKKEPALRKQFQRAKTKIEKNLNEKGVTVNNEKISVF